MRILALDTSSNVLDWCMRCQSWGHEVLWYDKPRKNGERRMAGKGIVPKVIDYDLLRTKYLDWADLIFMADNTYYTELLDPYRRTGYPVFGPSPQAAELELDRAKGQEAMKACGLATIPGVEFNDYDQAAKFVEAHPTFLVSKPSGDADKALSFVADDAASLSFMLTERWKPNEKLRHDAKQHGFILQEKLHGCEMAVGGWFGPGGWNKCWYVNFEYKPLMAGDFGPNTGEMGTLSMYCPKEKLADIALQPLTKMLHDMDYVGFIDVSGMVTEDGKFYPFEFTTRPGWPTFHNQTATHDGDPAQWMLDLINGKDTLQVKQNVHCISVVKLIPGETAHMDDKQPFGIPIYGADDREHVHLSEVMLSDDPVPVQVNGKVVRMPNYISTGDYICVVTGCGETITGARRSAYAAAAKIKMPVKPFHRPDIGRGRLIEGLPLVQKHGFATNFKVM